MDEDIAIIDTKTRNEKIKNFFVEKKKDNNIRNNTYSCNYIKLLFLSNLQKWTYRAIIR